jgi:UDP-2,4-diacetamido-2,4,6-trideoxy-beta-L-altropyranose hydrolase
MSSNISLRPANMNDINQIFHWRNDERVRKWSLSSSMIDWEAHHTWFTNSLTNPERTLLVAMEAYQSLGVVRFDKEQDTVEISVYLSPTQIGKGLGLPLILASQDWAKTHLMGVKKILAKVLLENIPSQKVFVRAGFIEHHRWSEQNEEKGIVYYYELHGES